MLFFGHPTQTRTIIHHLLCTAHHCCIVALLRIVRITKLREESPLVTLSQQYYPRIFFLTYTYLLLVKDSRTSFSFLRRVTNLCVWLMISKYIDEPLYVISVPWLMSKMLKCVCANTFKHGTVCHFISAMVASMLPSGRCRSPWR